MFAPSQTKLNTQVIIHPSILQTACPMQGHRGAGVYPSISGWRQGTGDHVEFIPRCLHLEVYQKPYTKTNAQINLLCVCQRCSSTDPYGHKHCGYPYEKENKIEPNRTLMENPIYNLIFTLKIITDCSANFIIAIAIFKTKVTTHPSLWLLKPTDSSYQTGRPWRSDYASTDPQPGSNNDWLPRDTGRGSQRPCSPPDKHTDQ